MSEETLLEYLSQIRQAATDACVFVHGLTKEEFFSDKRTQNAVLMSIFVIGESATKIMDKHKEFVRSHPEMPWRKMRGMRNRIAHGYFTVDMETVWDTTQTALPELLNQMPAACEEATDLSPMR